MDSTRSLVQWVEKSRYEDLTPEVIDMVKWQTLDTLGVLIAGSSALGCKAVVDQVSDWGGKEEASILVFGGKVPVPNAGLVNCTMARAHDFGDVHEGGGGHLSETFVPVTFILSEYASRPVSGKEFILALTLGSELSCRLRCAMTTFGGWRSETYAPFGIVATGGRLLDFSSEQYMDGMGIAYSQCSGNGQATLSGALTVRLQQGIAARSGLTSVMLAQRGITGARDVLEGEYGFFQLYAKNEYDPARITDGLGKRYELEQTSLKPFPCCKFTHVPIDATMQIVNEQHLKPGDVEEIIVSTNTNGYRMCASTENKYKPQTPMDAQFSIPYTVSTAVIRKKVFIDDFTDEAIKDTRVLEFCPRVKVNIDPEIDKLPGRVGPARIELKTKDGRHFSKYVEFVKGHPKNKMTWTECVDKFTRCAALSAVPLSEGAIAEVIDQVNNLENVQDVRRIVRLLQKGAGSKAAAIRRKLT